VKMRGRLNPQMPPPKFIDPDRRHGECRVEGDMEVQDPLSVSLGGPPCLPRRTGRSLSLSG